MFKLSVALCTFNGGTYLEQQLHSIIDQTRMPDELVICDDGSSDSTVGLLRDFQKNAPFEVSLIFNVENLGSTRNFENAISLCKGDLIVLADQDDIWISSKLELTEQVFIDDPSIGMVFTDAEVVDDAGQYLGYNLWEHVGLKKSQKKIFQSSSSMSKFRLLLRKDIVTGATMCFRSDLRNVFLPIPSCWIHDAWIANVCAMCDIKIGMLDLALIQYRQHIHQQIGAKKIDIFTRLTQILRSEKDRLLEKDVEKFKSLLMRNNLIRYGCYDDVYLEVVSRYIRAKILHLERRKMAIRSSFIASFYVASDQLLRFRYHMYSNGFSDFSKDLIVRFSMFFNL
jgi:glycosyltransferase involved in cell wall biosynthesis